MREGMVRTPAGYSFDWLRRNRLVPALMVLAPHADILIVKVVAALLAGSACSDALLIAADAIEEARDLLSSRTGDGAAERRSLTTLIDELRREAPCRAANPLPEVF